MLSWLAEFEDLWGPLRLFGFITFRGMGGAATALLICWILGPWLINRLTLLKAGQVLRDESEIRELAQLHGSKAGTPTMGGLLIAFSLLVSTLLWARPNIYVVTALFVFLAMAAVGAADDWMKISRKHSRGLPGRWKLLSQAAIALSALTFLVFNDLSGPHIRDLWVPFSKSPVLTDLPFLWLFPFFFLVIAGSSNAINLTDGVDGLAIGCSLTAAMAFGLMAYATGNTIFADYLLLPYLKGTGELTVLCAVLCGSCLGFLWFNAHPAQVFMGDTGSLALGGLIGVVALMILQPFTLVIVGGVFVMEASSVILQVASFQLTGRRIFRMAPIHHHFELRGWAETQVVIRFWILSLIFAIAGLATLKLR